MPPCCSIKNVADRGAPDPESDSKLLSSLMPSQASYFSDLLCRKFGLVVLFAHQYCSVSEFIEDVIVMGFPRQMIRIAAKRIAALMCNFMFFRRLWSVGVLTNDDMNAKLLALKTDKRVSSVLVMLPDEAIGA
jgi:hypothetical protein